MLMITNTFSQFIDSYVENGDVDEDPRGHSIEKQDYKDQGGSYWSQFQHVNLDSYESSMSDDEQLLQIVEVEVPDYEILSEDYDAPSSLRRNLLGPKTKETARQFAKKREFLQCRDEEPIVEFCFKSCHNVFKSICTGFTCPPRLIVKTKRDCHEKCKKSYKQFRGQKYVPPEKY
ncbi:hypothetical protein O0L34_g14850 [Tuta absoluta]|nr:hypothetical protein O0L34_g14850 [Tuta absoluta]